MEERNDYYTIAEEFTLPSHGQIYPVEVNPIVKLRSMTGKDEMRRLNPDKTQYKTLADIIEGCMIEKPKVHVYDMCIGDYVYLLYMLRCVTHGDAYKMSIVCPYCGKQVDSEAHLLELDVNEYDETKFEELRTFQLPMSGKTISIRYQTPRMLDELDSKVKEMKRRFKTAEVNFELLLLLSSVIETVDGEPIQKSDLERFIEQLPAKDITKIINNLDALNASIGVSNETIVECSSCGGEVQTFFRIGQEFFRPTNI